MQKNWLKYGFYLALCVVTYYVILPVSLQVQGLQFALVIVLVPALMLVGSGFWGYFYSFNLICPLMAGVLFLPAVFLFMNDSALIYALVYGIIALAGVSAGGIIRKYRVK